MEIVYLATIICLALIGIYYGMRDLMMSQVINDFGTYKTIDDEFDIDKMWEAINSIKKYEPMVTIIPASFLKTEHRATVLDILNIMPDVYINEYATEIVQFPKPRFTLATLQRDHGLLGMAAKSAKTTQMQ